MLKFKHWLRESFLLIEARIDFYKTSFKDGLDTGHDPYAINTIANHKNSTDAHRVLALAHREGRDIGDHAVQKLRSYGHNI